MKTFFLLFLLALSPLSAYSINFISADHKHYSYMGRIDFSTAKKPFISWPGTSIKASITGNKLVVVMDDQEGKNYFNVIINNNGMFPNVIALKKGHHEYNLSYMLTNIESTATTQIEIFKRTEGHEGGTYFHGLKLADNAKLLVPPKRLNKRIAFFGDSVTTGMGNEAPDNSPDNNSVDKNHYWSYASITARALNAEHHTVSSSGIGFMISWFDHAMPDVYDQISGVGNNDTQWDFSSWQPDVVVVNLGQNDSWLIDNEKRIQPSKTEIINAYKKLIKKLQAKYPKAKFICAMGSMDITAPYKSHWPSYIKAAVAQLNSENSGDNIELITFKHTSFTKHPRVHQHVANAKQLTNKIKALMNW